MNLLLHVFFNSGFQPPSSLCLKNDIYNLWRKQWEQIYADQGSSHIPTADDFTRHDIYMALRSGETLVAFSAHSFADLNDLSTLDLDYFRMFGENYPKLLLKMKLLRLVSFESLVVHPEFRKNEWQLSLGTLLININNYLLRSTSAQAMIAVARNDNKVANGLRSVGYRTVEANKSCRGFPCDLMALTKEESVISRVGHLENLAKKLWDTRQIHLGEDVVPTLPLKKARSA